MSGSSPPERGPTEPHLIYWLALAHHRREEASRCVHLGWGRWRVAVCGRCAGLYPVLAAVLVVQGVLEVGPQGGVDWWLALAGVVPLMMDWGAGRLGAAGTNRRRLVTGAIGGAALSRSLYLHFRDPTYDVLWVQLALVCFAVLAVEVVRSLRLRDPGTGSPP